MNPDPVTPEASGAGSIPGRLDHDVRRYLDEQLPAADPKLPFFEAVVLHLGAGPTAVLTQMEAAREVVRIVRSPYNTEASRLLLESPALLASIFQNADLLDSDDPDAARLGKAVMKALEAMTGHEE